MKYQLFIYQASSSEITEVYDMVYVMHFKTLYTGFEIPKNL